MGMNTAGLGKAGHGAARRDKTRQGFKKKGDNMPIIKRQVWLNYNGENHIYYTYASSDARALKNARCKLEDELGKMRGALKNYFNGDKPNFEVKII